MLIRLIVLFYVHMFQQAFSGIDSKTNSSDKDPKMEFSCNLENVILSDDVFTDNLDWIEKITFDGCYIQDGMVTILFVRKIK